MSNFRSCKYSCTIAILQIAAFFIAYNRRQELSKRYCFLRSH